LISIGPAAIANAIKDMRALSVLSLKDNSLCNKEAGRALSEMLAGNTVLKELDVSLNSYYNCDGAGFAQELAVGLGDNGALSLLDLASNCLCGVNVNGYGTYDASGSAASSSKHNTASQSITHV
jgi:hypothetical protein